MTARPAGTRRRLERAGWAVGAFVLAAGSIPWSLWRDSTVAAGLPLWLWWHIGWLCLASLGLLAFTRYGWGIGVESGAMVGATTDDAAEATDD